MPPRFALRQRLAEDRRELVADRELDAAVLPSVDEPGVPAAGRASGVLGERAQVDRVDDHVPEAQIALAVADELGEA